MNVRALYEFFSIRDLTLFEKNQNLPFFILESFINDNKNLLP